MPIKPKQHKGGGRADEAVNAMRGIDRAEQREGAGCGQYARDIGVGDAFDRHLEAGAADELAGCHQRDAEDGREDQPQFGAENAGLDGVADKENAAQRQRQAADPHCPARAERGLDGWRRRPWRRRCRFGAGVALRCPRPGARPRQAAAWAARRRRHRRWLPRGSRKRRVRQGWRSLRPPVRRWRLP